MPGKKINWGILGAGKICHDFVLAFTALPASEHQVIGVSARSKESAEEFAKDHGIPKAFNSYLELLQSPEIDIVYIGTIHINHLELGKLALENGKHVLCEKPLCLDLKETRELVNLAKAKGLFLLEAIWSRHFPAYERLREIVRSGQLGEITQVNVNFGFKAPETTNLRDKELGGGVMLPMGMYAIQFAQLVYGGAKPLAISALGHLNKQGTEEHVSVSLKYPNGKFGTLVISIQTALSNEGEVIGEKGKVTVPYFYAPSSLRLDLKKDLTNPFSLDLDTTVEEFPKPKLMDGKIKQKSFNYPNGEGLSYQCHEVRKRILNGEIESPRLSHEESCTIAEINEEIRRQLGVL